ncbi:MAG: glycerol-3-phosphate 1-O-acyltransferase PlsY [Clostridia bacterium]|nr:glycerol-3-phosphate 1-O-acyltransferase PlsY [Clostridia bacterium]
MFESFSEFLHKGLLGKIVEGIVHDDPNVVFQKNLPILILGFVIAAIVPYLLGSFNSAIIVSKRKFNDDIRQHGSGNGGLTNTLRTYGKAAAGLTLLGDTMKAFISVAFGYLIFGYWTASIAALFCMLGHMFPCFYKFKGGKGVLVTAASMLLIDPITFVICILIFIIIVAGTKFVSLGSVMGAIFFPLILNRVAKITGNVTLLGLPCAVAVIMAVLVVFMHRANIKRLLNGTESKISFKKKTPPAQEIKEETEEDK